ncbi:MULTISPECIES: LysR family transcriptional regulator [unclassified Roseovarius]|uniref:LysR family transcriptional regulator n=1 Tax=unclassified Roseovarius TaxID=2614913 RepID=UPI00273D559F|nr:LysR family transcriptional regulator [Roseovarius sp. MMSF_3350]
MQDIKPIRVFLEVAERRSFAAAARALDMTPSSVTRIIAKLEDSFGQQLLLRTTRKVSLTDAGAVVAARYRPLLTELDATTDALMHAAHPDQGRLRLNAPMSLGLRLMPGLIAAFRDAYPRIDLGVTLTDRFVDIIEDPYDLSIRISGPPSDKSTIWRKICEVPRHAVAAPSLFADTAPPADPADLLRELCLSHSATGTPETWEFTRDQAQRSVQAGSSLITNNGDLLYQMARHGQGITVLPDFLVADGLASGEVTILMPDWQVTPLWLTLFYPPYEAFPPLVATFTTFFEDYIRRTAPVFFRFT